MLRRLATFLGLALLAAPVLGQQGYAQRTQNIRAAVLTMDATRYGVGQPAVNDTPFVWLNVDSNRRAKPAGWNFYNPLAPGLADASIVARWGAISGIVGGTGPALGSQIDKRKAAYWELRLSTASDSQMASYDVLQFSGYRYVSLNSAEREKLRRYVDGGGILWVDLYQDASISTQIDTPNNFPVPFKEAYFAAGQLTYADVFHPLLNSPNTLTLSNLESMATDGDRTVINALLFTTPGISGLDRLLMPLPEESQKMLPVAGTANGPAVAVARLGDGFIVVTTRGYANALNRVRLNTSSFNNSYDPNNRYQAAQAAFDPIADTAAKFVVNLVNLGSSFSQSQQGSRKQNSSFVGIGAPLLKRFDASAVNGQATAVIYKGLLVVTTDTKVVVYDANPVSDLDADGNSDDGIQDYSLGGTYDEIWESAVLTGPISAPTCAEVPNGNGVPTDQIMVTDGTGKLDVFNAFPTDPTGRLAGAGGPIALGTYNGYSVAMPTGSTFVSTTSPSAPTFHEGLVVVGDTISTGFGNNAGRVWIADARNGTLITSTADFQLGGGVLPEFSGSPLVGYIPIADNSGGVDRVIYLAGKASSSGAFPTASISSIWLGAKGETPRPGSATATAANLTIQTRAFSQGLPIYLPNTSPGVPSGSGLGVKLTIIDPVTGDPWTAVQIANYFDNTVVQGQPGELIYTTHNPLPLMADGVTPNIGIRVDYTIDWGGVNAALATQLIRGSLSFPDDVSRAASDRRHILGNLALSPKGTLYAVLSTADDSSASSSGGSFYELKEEGRGSFRVFVRYDLYPPHTFSLSGANPVTIPATVDDVDDLTNLPGVGTYLGGQFGRLTFTGGPTVRNGVVYVTAQGHKFDNAVPFKRFIPFTLLMAFNGEPDIPTIKVGDFPDGSTIVQPDITQTSGGQKGTPNRYNTLQNVGSNPQFTYDAETGTIYINNLSNVTRGQMSTSLSLSQPIIVKSPNGAADRWFWPDATGSNWSPLLWYKVEHGSSNVSAPFVAGNTLYMAETTALPNFLTKGFPPGVAIVNNGVGFAMDAVISPTDPFIVTNSSSGKPWVKQVEQLKIVGAGPNPDIQPNPAIRWPQTVGQQSYDSFIQRLLQTEIGNATVGFANSGLAVLGGDRALVLIGKLSSGDAIYSGFSRSDVVVADQGRVVRFDPSGNPIWATDVTLSSDPSATGSTRDLQGLVRPTRAYLYGDNDVLAVDPATNRIVRLDSTGQAVRTISGFKLDTTFTPDGYKPGEKLTLDSPADVATYGEYVPGPRLASNPMSNAAPLEYWYHYVVADAGNHRLVDIVDRYVADPTTRRVLTPVMSVDPQNRPVAQLGVLAWHTPASLSGKQYSYSSVTRIVPSTVAGGNYFYVAGLGNSLPTRVDVGLDNPGALKPRESQEGNGGLVIFDPSNNISPSVINEIVVPAIPANVFWNDATGTFSSPAIPAHTKRMSSLTSVTARNFGAATTVMFTDATGVYEVVPTGTTWTVRWMLPNEAYRVMRGVYNLYDPTRAAPFNAPGVPASRNPADFRATYARRLDSGEVLIVNGYSGVTRGDLQANGSFLNRLPFGGEVLQVNGDVDPNPADTNAIAGFGFQKTNLGFGYLSIKFELPPVSGARTLLQPVFADRR